MSIEFVDGYIDGVDGITVVSVKGAPFQRVFVTTDEPEWVAVYGSLADAQNGNNTLGVISRLEWDEHDRAGEYGACSICDDTHYVDQVIIPWQQTIAEIMEEQFKQPKIEA